MVIDGVGRENERTVTSMVDLVYELFIGVIIGAIIGGVAWLNGWEKGFDDGVSETYKLLDLMSDKDIVLVVRVRAKKIREKDGDGNE